MPDPQSQSTKYFSSEEKFLHRQQRLEKILDQFGFDALVLNPGPSLVYLTGLNFHLMERPVIAIFKPGGQLTLIIPQLETAKTSKLSFPVQAYQYGEDPGGWLTVFRNAISEAGLKGKVGVEPTRLRFLELRLIENASSKCQFVSGEECLEKLRITKDSSEIDLMRKAVQIAQTALEKTIPVVKIGATERYIAAELTQQLLHAGSDSEFPFSPIVSGGPNSANPHATPTERPLASGDLLVIDWGAYCEGYCSDLTRTFAIGQVDAEYYQIGEIVKQANDAGRAAAAPGVQAGSIDAAARNVIEQAGYGPFFSHRTGHGIGLEGHEAPYIRAGNPVVLEPGMTFTVEPGIYLAERNGVRIEDNVVITENGAETLSTLPRELFRISDL